MTARSNFRVPSAECQVPGASLALSTKHYALSTLLALSLVSGCVYRGAKITEGTDLAIGLTVPGTEGVLQFNALNYLSGFRLGVAENAALTVEYSTVATNSYFGIVTTETAKRIKAKVEPCETVGSAAVVPGAECLEPRASDAQSTLSSPDLSCAAGASSPSNAP